MVPEIYDMKRTKEEYVKYLTFWGGISTQRLLPFATPDEIKRVSMETIKIMSDQCGYIAAPTHSVPGDVPVENILALIEVFQKEL